MILDRRRYGEGFFYELKNGYTANEFVAAASLLIKKYKITSYTFSTHTLFFSKNIQLNGEYYTLTSNLKIKDDIYTEKKPWSKMTNPKKAADAMAAAVQKAINKLDPLIEKEGKEFIRKGSALIKAVNEAMKDKKGPKSYLVRYDDATLHVELSNHLNINFDEETAHLTTSSNPYWCVGDVITQLIKKIYELDCTIVALDGTNDELVYNFVRSDQESIQRTKTKRDHSWAEETNLDKAFDIIQANVYALMDEIKPALIELKKNPPKEIKYTEYPRPIPVENMEIEIDI